MNIKSICGAGVLTLALVSSTYGQGLFSGKGGASDGNKWGWANSEKKSEGSSEIRERRMFDFMPSGEKKNYPKPFTMGDSESSENNGFLGLGRPAWMKERDPSEPTMMEKMNQSSTEFFQNSKQSMSNWRRKTGENLRNANQNIRENTSETWESMTKGLPGWMKGQRNPSDTSQPPARTANKWLGSDGGSKFK